MDTPVTAVDPKAADEVRGIALLLDVPVPVEVILDRRILTVREILDLEVGSILTLSRSAGENVDVIVNGVPLCIGEMVVIETQMGVRVTDFQCEE